MSEKSWGGWITVLGGFLIHLVLGTLYVWANITNAVTSYLRQFNPTLTYDDTIIVYAAALAAQGCTMLLGGLISQKIGPRYCCLLGSTILITGTFLASISTTFFELLFAQGIMLGLGIGLCYTAPISAAVRWMPQRKGMVTGIIVGGFGCGAFVYGFIATSVVNPDKENVATTGSNANYFPPDSPVLRRVPWMFVTLGLCYIVCLGIGCALLSEPSPISGDSTEIQSSSAINPLQKRFTKIEMTVYQTAPSEEAEEEIVGELSAQKHHHNDYSKLPNLDPLSSNLNQQEKKAVSIEMEPREILTSPLAWHVASCLITTAVGGMYLAGTFKTYGQQHIRNESFLASVSSTASLFNTFGRFFWGWLADSIGPLRTLQVMSLLFATTIITYSNSIALGEAGFGLWTFLIFFFEGANFVLYVPVTVLLFGAKYSASNYGLIFSSYSLFVVLNIYIMAGAKVSFDTASISMGLLTGLGFLNLLLLEIHIQSSRKNLLEECKFR
mmetsp:Transcript_10470/g.11278  ORF Transcript_10470/g.11278 Transcript_10470/m.11278 type:complete len:498 (-) Transcript_10470:327-1820(-)|eukprot:gene990-1050_t